MVQGRKSGLWFKDFDLVKYEPYILSPSTHLEIRELILLSLVKCMTIQDEEGLKALGSIVCYYQRPPAIRDEEEAELNEPDLQLSPRPNVVFPALTRLCIGSACFRAMSRIMYEGHRHIQGRLKSHRAVFDHIVRGISPLHLCIQSPSWGDAEDWKLWESHFTGVPNTWKALVNRWRLQSVAMTDLSIYDQFMIGPGSITEIRFHFSPWQRVIQSMNYRSAAQLRPDYLTNYRREFVKSALRRVNQSSARSQQEPRQGIAPDPKAVQACHRLILEGDTSFIPTEHVSVPDLSWLGNISYDRDSSVDQRLKEMIDVRYDDHDDEEGDRGCQCRYA